ncbi:centrosomal protein of 63 kDa-like [Littorina saxatilis]|uniref:CEP63/Deup1 N-terminal domain-containing protein n=1 Tax=Littorina saxatilis TaxID=31220 RepID=A0AAN9G206_9CAEN
MDKISSVWAELQLSNRLPSGTLMSSCQTELQELMYQLDVMLSAKKQQWMQETEELQTQLHAKEKELRSQQTALEIKTREMEDVKNQMEGLNKAQKAIVDEYEDHLSSLRAEVLKVRKEYEKLHRQHQRYKKDLQRKKDQVLAEKKESDKEIRRLREKLEEYEGKEQEWEVKFKGQQHENDMLEAQNRTLAEKCQFVQQQSATYQSQVGRRREMQDTAEDSLKARITQLEASHDRSAQTVLSQKDKIEKLKGSLEDAMTSHKQTMGDNEKLLTDLQKANETIQLLEERIAELEDELRSKAQMLHAAQDDSRQYSHDLLNMEHTLNAKDEIIKRMGGPQEYQESEQVKKLKDALQKAKDDLKSQKQSQQSLKQATSSSSTSAISAISASSTPKSSVNMSQNYRDSPQLHKQQELKEKIEVQCLQLEVQKLQEQVLSVNDVHGTELTSMRKKLGELTTELNQRNASLATLSEKSSELERSLRDESDTLDKKVAELKVAHAQVQLLRAENGQLRRDRLHEGNLDGDGSIPSNSASRVMRREMHVLRNSVEDMEHIMRSQHNSARTETSHNETSHTIVMSDRHSGSQGNTESGSERHGAMDEYLHSNIRRYDDQLQFLETQKARLEAQMSESSRQNLRIAAEERKLHEAAERRNPHCDHHHDETQGSEAMSLVSEGHFPKIDRLQLPNSSSDDELPDMAEDASRAFYSQEHQYTDQLERRLNARINNFTHGLDH